jgi:hypothetical protein
MRKNRCVRFEFFGSTVQVACRGWQVSFYTTEGDLCLTQRTEKLDIDKVSICSNSSYIDF